MAFRDNSYNNYKKYNNLKIKLISILETKDSIK